MRRSTTLAALLAAGLASGVGVTALSPAQATSEGPTVPPVVESAGPLTVDSRTVTSTVAPTTAQRDAAKALIAAAEPGARLTWDPRFGTPRSVIPGSGPLSAARTGAPADVARAWIAEHAAAFRMSSAQVAALAVARDHELPGTGTHVVTFLQTFEGTQAVRGGRLTVAVDSTGRVTSYSGDPVGGGALAGSFDLTPAEALSRTVSRLAPGTSWTPTLSTPVAGYTTFERGPFASSSYVRKAAFPTKDGARAAYRVMFVKDLDAAWEVVVDAVSGAELYRTSLVTHASGAEEPSGTVYDNYPGATGGGTPRQQSFGATPQSPKGYVDPVGVVGTGVTTLGNNASTYANYSNFIAPADQAPRPVSPTGQFHYTYVNRWAATQGATVPPSYVEDLNPAATNLFWHHNRIHDEFYELGFTETAGNFQADNHGKGGLGQDPIIGLVHAGAASGGAPTYTGRDNAYMLTLDDGIAPWSGMFLWEPINDAFEGPHADGNFDAGVIEHEYAHGLSNRYVAGGSALGSHQAGSMGEGWSDWYALNYLYTEGLAKKAVVGQHVTGNESRGIRNWDYDTNPTTFGDMGYDLTGPEVHADGEIWTTTLWDLRKALVAKHGAAKGGEVAARLVTDAMPLTAPDPSFLDARNGILAADLDRYHGENTDLIWSVFAKRGAGASAVSRTGDDTDPTPAFDVPAAAANGTLVGTVRNASTGAAVPNARVIVGRLEARVSPLARTSSTGGFGARMTPGTYPVTIQAPGFGSQTIEGVTVTAGKTTSRTFSLAPNLTSLASGATIVSASSEDDGLPAKFALDDTAASVWSTKAGTTAYNAGPDQRVTVKLAKPSTVSSVRVSAFKDTGSSRFAALKDFTLQTSSDGVTWKTVKTGGFGYQTPRPTAADLNYRTFTFAPVTASHVRFFIDSVQGDTTKYAQVAEVQVFGSGTAVTPVAPTPDPVFTDSGTIVAGNPAAGDPTGLATVFGVTGTEMTNVCMSPPASQGADAWVTKLPAGSGDGLHTVTVKGDPTPAGHDIDLYFLNSSCELTGSAASSAADESAVVPGGTAYVLSQLWTGANVPITLTSTDAG